MKPITVCSYKTQIIGHIVSDFFCKFWKFHFLRSRRIGEDFMNDSKNEIYCENNMSLVTRVQLYKPAATQIHQLLKQFGTVPVFQLLISSNDGGLSLDNQSIPEGNCWGFFFPLSDFLLHIYLLCSLCWILREENR